MEPLKPKSENAATQAILLESFEQDLLAYFKSGLSPQIKTFVQLADPESFEEALEKARNYEAEIGIVAESVCVLGKTDSEIAYEEKIEQWFQENKKKSRSQLEKLESKITTLTKKLEPTQQPKDPEPDWIEKLEKAIENLSVCVIESRRKYFTKKF